MTMHVIVDMTAAAGKGDELAEALRGLYDAMIGNQDGLVQIRQLRDSNDPDHIVEFETWDEHGQHAAWSEQAMKSGILTPIFPLLGAAPVITSHDQTGVMDR